MRKSATVLAGLSLLALAGCSTGAEQESYSVTLNKGNELPAATSNADNSGASTGTLTLTSDGVGSATFRLAITGGLLGITQAHIHSPITTANAATGAPVSVFLFDGPATDAATGFTGNLGCTPASNACTSAFNQATISAGATAAGATNSFDGLMTSIRSHTAYVNVHTTSNPGGAIRGNF
jgi:hypothetical protein